MGTNLLSDYILEKSDTAQFHPAIGIKVSCSLKEAIYDIWVELGYHPSGKTNTVFRKWAFCTESNTMNNSVHTHRHTHCSGSLSLHFCPVPTGGDHWSLCITPIACLATCLFYRELPADVLGDGLRMSLSFWRPSGFCMRPGIFTGTANESMELRLKVDFLHSWAKGFQLSSQRCFTYMVLATMSWDKARIWPDFYTRKQWNAGVVPSHNKRSGLSDWHTISICLEEPLKRKGLEEAGVSTQFMPGPGQRRGGWGLGEADEEKLWVTGGIRCQMELQDSAAASLCTCVVTRGLPGYEHCFTSVS